MGLFDIASEAAGPAPEAGPRQPLPFDTLPASAPSGRPAFDPAFDAAAAEYGVDADVLRGVAFAESRFRQDVIEGKVKSSTGAVGVTQWMPDTAKEYGIDPLDPVQSIFGTAAYLRKSLDKFGGDMEKAIASYNAGPNRYAFTTDEWKSRMPKETQGYLDTVLAFAQGQAEKRGPKKELPDGVEPSDAGGGRGVVNPPMVEPAQSQPPLVMDTSDPLTRVQSSVPGGAMQTFVATDPTPRSVLDGAVGAPNTGPTRRSAFLDPIEGPSMRAGQAQPNPMGALGAKVADASLPVRALAKAATTGAQGIGGLVRATGDLAGLPKVAAFGAAGAAGASAFDKGMGENGPIEGFGPKSPLPYLADMAEGAGSSMVNMALLGGAVGPKAALWAMGLQTVGQEYDQARNQGLEPGMALAGAAVKGGFEVAGEKLAGVDKVLASLGTLLTKGATEQAKRSAGQALLANGIKEVPGEVFTYLGQSATDLLPGIGIQQDMTVSDFLGGLRDTVVQASMMGGAMGAGGAVINRNVQDVKPMPSAEQMARAKGFLTPQATPRVEDQPTTFVVPQKRVQPAEKVESDSTSTVDNAPVAPPVSSLLATPEQQSLSQRASALIQPEVANASNTVALDGSVSERPGSGGSLGSGGERAGGPVAVDTVRGLPDRSAGDAGRSEPAGLPRNDGGQPAAVNAALAPVVGKPIDKDWASFSQESGTLGIPRAEMPQVKAEHRGAMVNFLNARGIEHERDTVDPASLKPTQAEFSPEKVLKAVGSTEGDRSILVSQDGHVLDGHHQWLAALKTGEPVNVIRLDAPVKELLDAVHEFPSSEVAGGVTQAVQEQPKTAGGAGAIQSAAATANEADATKAGPGGVKEPIKAALLMKDGTPFQMVRQWTGNYHLMADGKKIGQLTYTTSLPGEFKAAGVMVSPEYQRKGVATAAYDFIEQNIIGKPFDRAGGQSAAGAAFRADRDARQRAASETTTALDRAEQTSKDALAASVSEDSAAPEKTAETAKTANTDQAPMFSRSTQTELPSFKNWFGDSKVVDAQGNPIVMFHGTRADISEFKGSRFYFTADPTYASGYGDAGSVMPVYLSLQNPLDLTSLGAGRLSEQSVLNAMAAKGVDVGGLRGLVRRKDGSDDMGVWAWWHNATVREAVQKAGFDSAVQREATGAGKAVAYIAFDPNQIKSAIGNRGAFDSTDPRISFKRSSVESDSTGISPADAATVVEIFAGYGMDLQVADTLADAPENVQENAKSQGVKGVRGFYDRESGKLWLVRNNIASVEEGFFVALHESFHRGWSRTFGSQASAILDQIYLGNQNVREQADSYAKLHKIGRLEAIEEVLADMAGEGKAADLKGWARLVKFLKGLITDMAQKLGITVPITDAMVEQLVAGVRFVGMGEMQQQEQSGESFSREPRNALQALSESDELFRFKKSDKDTIEGIAGDTIAGVTVKRSKGPLTDIYTLTMPDGAEAKIMVRQVNPYGPQQYGLMDRGDGQMDVISERPGDNPEDVSSSTEDVYTDVSKLKEGGAGAAVYHIAANFAHNTGRIFIGDPNGLSDIAMRRRTEQMLSSALKFGTTEHLAPHPRQVEGDRFIGVPPMKWTYGDDASNIESLVRTSNAAFDYADTNPLTFEQGTGRFIDRSGNELDGHAISSLVRKGSGREARAGVATLKRNAILNSLLLGGSAPRSERGAKLLDNLLDVAGQPGSPASKVFYSRVAGQPGGFDLPEFGKVAHSIEAIQNRYNRWKQALDAVNEQGGLVDDTNDFYAAEERYWGIVGNQADDFADEVKDFVKAVRTDKLSVEQVSEYAYALHAPERNAQIAKINPKMPDGGSGMTDAEAAAIIAKAGADKAALDKHAATLHAWTAGTRDVLETNGLISASERAAWEAPYQNYVPLRGQPGTETKGGKGTGQGFDVRGKESTRALGRRSQAEHIIENIVQDRTRALVRAGKNEVLRRFAKFVLDNPDPSLWEINGVEKRRSLTTDANGDQTVVDHLDIDKLPEHTVAVKDGGDTIYIRVHDDKLLEQLKNLNRDDIGKFVGAMLWANRQMSRMYTTLSPVFALFTNPARDFQAGTMNMIGSRGFKDAGKLAMGVPMAWGPAFKAEVMGKPSPMYREFQMSGGKTGFLDYKDVDAQAKAIRKLVSDADITWNPATWVTGQGWATPLLAGSKAVRTTLSGIEAVTGVMENATRFAAYKVARENGESVASAASLSKNLTVNFNRKGTMTAGLSAWFLFFNPAVQGSTRMLQALKNPKVLATLGLGMTGIALLALQNAGAGDDDDGVAWWDKIPDEVKERNLVIVLSPESKEGEKIPGTKTGRYLKIPMPYGYNVFAVMANSAVDHMRWQQDPKRGKSAGRAAAAVTKAFLGSWVPVAEFGASLDNSAALALSAVPAALKPLGQNLLDINAFGRKMYRNDAQAQNLPDSQNFGMADRGTVGQRITEKLNTATGGSKFREGAISITPAAMNNALRGYGGAPVTFAADMANVFLRNGVERDEPDWYRAPFAKQVYGRIDGAADQAMAYDKIADIQKKALAFKRAADAGDKHEAGEVLKAEGPLTTLGKAAQDTQKTLSDIRKAETQIIDDPKMSDTQKTLRLRNLDLKARQAAQGLSMAVNRAIDNRGRVDAKADELLTAPAK